METTTQGVQLPTPGEIVDAVDGVLHLPSRAEQPAVLLVHGAGGDLDGAGLVALADALATRGHTVVRVNLPYRQAGRGSPPRADRAVPGYRALFDAARRQIAPEVPWVAGGKSYGGRVASMAAAEGMDCAGLLFYGYPLHPPGKPEKLRVDHWPQLTAPCCFLQGTRDPFCDLELLDANLRRLGRRAHVEVVEGGDHSLKVVGKHAPDGQPRSPAAVFAQRGDAITDWLRTLDG